jgi:hypothetical protein
LRRYMYTMSHKSRRNTTINYVHFSHYFADCAPVQSQPLPGNTQNAARIALAQEFVRELEVLYRLQETAKKEFAEDDSGPGRIATGIRVGTRTILQLNDSINRLSMIKVDGRWAEFKDLLKQIHQERIARVQELNQMAKALASGPEPGVNYGRMTARAPDPWSTGCSCC